MDILYALLPMVSAVAGVIIGYSMVQMRESKRKRFANSKGDLRKCIHCGKEYSPLLDENYQPEPDICRDCLWKLTYDLMFGDK